MKVLLRDGVFLALIIVMLIVVTAYAAVDAAGWRPSTSFLSGSLPDGLTTWDAAVSRGVFYVLAHFGLVLAAPIFGIAAILYGILRRYCVGR